MRRWRTILLPALAPAILTASAGTIPAWGQSAVGIQASHPQFKVTSKLEANLAAPATANEETGALPDAPSAVAAREANQDQAAPEQPALSSPRPAANRVMGPTFLAANGMLLGSTIANVQVISNCRPTSCQAVPGAIRSRGDLYAIGIPSSLAISYISYRLKRGGTKLWIVPVAIFTAGNVVYAAHSAQFSK